MRAIAKNQEPASLAQHRCNQFADYDNYADKQALRQSLVAEQRGLCCYCLSRITPEAGRMKIAHWHSQNQHPDEQLDYLNLLGACLGGQGKSPLLQHCDTRQGNRDISKNPANPAHQVERLIHFEGDGTITSDDVRFNGELNETLNLNTKFLKNNRKATLDAFKMTLDKRGQPPPLTLERWLREWNGETRAGELQPFCQIVVYWLRKRISQA